MDKVHAKRIRALRLTVFLVGVQVLARLWHICAGQCCGRRKQRPGETATDLRSSAYSTLHLFGYIQRNASQMVPSSVTTSAVAKKR